MLFLTLFIRIRNRGIFLQYNRNKRICVKVTWTFAYIPPPRLNHENIHRILQFKFKRMIQVDEKFSHESWTSPNNIANEMPSLNLDQSLTQSPFIHLNHNLDILHFFFLLFFSRHTQTTYPSVYVLCNLIVSHLIWYLP